MAKRKQETPQDKSLGLNSRICRRDFLNSTLLASGSLLLGPLSPRDLIGQEQDDWTGYGGVGDYSDANGNTAAVMNAGHAIRDHVFDSPPSDAIETGETFDCVVVGGGISGLAAALFFQKQAGKNSTCLVLENHPIFGGESRRNEFLVDGQRLMASQGPDHFQIPFPHSFIAHFYDWVGIDLSQFKYQTWNSPDPEIPLGRTFEQMPSRRAVYFGAKFGQKDGLWLVDPKNLEGVPIPPAMRDELLAYRKKRRDNEPKIEYPGDDVSRRLDSMTIEKHLMKDYGLRQETIRTMMTPGEGGGFGLGPDALSAYCEYAFDALHCLDDSPETGWQSFPDGNSGIARHMVKTLIPDSIPGPKSLEAICRNNIDFAQLDRPGQSARIRLGSTVVRVEHAGKPKKSSFVWVTYTREGKVYRLKARSVVMAGGCWSTKRVVRDLPAIHSRAYDQFFRSPCLVANVAVRNWRFLYRLGVSGVEWYEGLGSFMVVHTVPQFSTDIKSIGPDSPVVLTIKVVYCYPGLPIEDQGNHGRMELLGTPYRDYEKQIREQMTQMFSRYGFDARRDIAGIILNRWGHAYVNPQPGFFFGLNGQPAPREVLRAAPFGRIAFANTDLTGTPDHKTAITEGHRAVNQLLDQVLV